MERFNEVLTRAGFSSPLKVGDTVLPAPVFGNVSLHNAEGKLVVHRDQPMETAYRQTVWNWNERHGPYLVPRSRIVDVPYKRYPRTRAEPPSVELSLVKISGGGVAVAAAPVPYDDEHAMAITHIINLFLEMFGECEVFNDGLDEVTKIPLRRLNWVVLPPGRRPWEQLLEDVKPVLQSLSEGVRPVVTARLKAIHDYGPEFVAQGTAGFRGYLVFGFPDDNLFLLESMFYGNATYVFEQDWERLSKLTKAEILSEHLQRDRFIHRNTWAAQVKKLLEHRVNGATQSRLNVATDGESHVAEE